MTEAWLGRYQRGSRVALTFVLSASPTACPVVEFWHEATTKIKTVSMPAHKAKRRLFAMSQYLDADFVDGHYVATIRYTISGVDWVHYRWFEVIGGDAAGSSIAITEMRRPLGHAVVMQREDGHISMGYNPRVT